MFYLASPAAKQISQIAQVAGDSGGNRFEKNTPKAPMPDGLGDIKSEINKLADKIKLIQDMFWGRKSTKSQSLSHTF